MKKNISFKLVKGVFTALDAKEVLFKLINSKIKYHQLEAFSANERNSGDTNYQSSRIEELQTEKENLKHYLLEAEKENKKLKIDGIISIDIISE